MYCLDTRLGALEPGMELRNCFDSVSNQDCYCVDSSTSLACANQQLGQSAFMRNPKSVYQPHVFEQRSFSLSMERCGASSGTEMAWAMSLFLGKRTTQIMTSDVWVLVKTSKWRFACVSLISDRFLCASFVVIGS